MPLGRRRMKDFFAELRRRHVFRVGLAYIVVAWLVVQVVNNLIPLMGIPLWAGKLILLALVAGFPVALVLAWAYEMTPDGLKRDTGPSDAPAPSHGFGRKWDFVIIAGLVVGLGYFVWQRQLSAPPQPLEAARAAEASIAVLPFADLSPDKDQEYFSDGLSEELLNQLAHVRGLRVIGRTSSFAFKGKNEDLREIGKALGVNHILEGSVRKAGDRVRITAQLIDPADGSHLWSQTYDRTLSDIFAVQEEIARTVASALSISIGALDLEEGGTKNFEAYDAYLSGHAQQFRTGTGDILKGISDLERAVEIDPKFTLAWQGLIDLYRVAAITRPGATDEWRAKMAQAGDQVIALAPDSPTAKLVLADRALSASNFVEADRLLSSIKDLPPNIGYEGHLWNCLFLMSMGRAKESISCNTRMVQTEPVALNPSLNLQGAYEMAGDFDREKAEHKRALGFASDDPYLRATTLMMAFAFGDRDEVKQALQALPGDEPPTPFSTTIARLIDTPDAARSELRRRFDDPKSYDDVGGLNILAIWAAYFEDPKLSLEAWRKYQRQLDIYSLWTVWRPIFKDMRRLPGFKQFVRDIGLVDYWRESGNWSDFCHPLGNDDFECE